MLKYINRKNNNIFIHKFQWIHGNNKPYLKSIILNTTNNNIIKNKNLIYILYYDIFLLFNQKPKLKKCKKSNANFKTRINEPIGTLTSINFKSNYWNINKILCFINPNLNTKLNNKINYQYKNKKYNILINYGIKNLSSNSFEEINKIGGANISYVLISPVKYLPFYYLK